MRVLVINCGSSSVKISVYDQSLQKHIFSYKAERLGTTEACVIIGDRKIEIPNGNHKLALEKIVQSCSEEFDAIVHRVVHGGSHFSQPVRITSDVISQIEKIIPLAPLHNPANIAGIHASIAIFPELPHVAIFDTAFHGTLPRRAYSYAIPRSLAKKHNVRRFGFHGPSHEWVANRASSYLEQNVEDLRIITCHLGNGASCCAVEYGRSIETSMGMTPLEGLVMGTRSGDIDPGAVFSLMRAEDLSPEEMEEFLNRSSGLHGLSGVGNDMRDIAQAAEDGNDQARLSIHVYAHRIRKYIGAYSAIMGGVDAIVFTAGVGENSARIRQQVAQRLDFLGARLDLEKNREARVSKENDVADISEIRSRVSILVVATDEERAMAEKAIEFLEQENPNQDLQIPIAISARHLHVTQAAVDSLFGKGHTLREYKPISQPGQFACVEKVDIIGPRRTIQGVRIIGPLRPKVQVEISRTDEFSLGIDAPVRNSGDVANSPGVILRGPNGDYTISEGVICARRHIHMHPNDAKRFHVSDRDVVEVSINSDGRDLTFGDVLVRVSPKYVLEMHIDTDEANAAQISRGFSGILAGVSNKAHLCKKRV
ncbi:MAG: acetate kinase [Deltaproteobacteria bacterium]|nr:acetate kinase [Deltaproteobacteria bacterium]